MTDPKKYKFNHSMIRVKDPKPAVEFYKFIGMTQINKLEFPDAKFDVYFMGYDSANSLNAGQHWTDREGLVELTHNYGTENDPNVDYHDGNAEPQGFGHTCISVDNIQAACKRIEDAGYKFKKRLSDGRMHNIAFIYDPDGYWVEVIGQKALEDTENVSDTDPGSYRMNHSMIRVKDPQRSVKFYEDIMGMQLKRSQELEGAGASVYFLAYGDDLPDNPPNGVNPIAGREGILELTHNHGTENDPNFKGYHDGNSEPQGFGHICLSVDDFDKACERFEEKGVAWKKRPTDGRMKNVAFVLDPDGYWIEIIQNEKLKPRSNW